MALKNSNERRLFRFWAAFSCYLVVNSKDVTKMELALFPKLGLKTIENLKPFKNEQELFVYVKLLQVNKMFNEVVDNILEFYSEKQIELHLQIILLDTLYQLEDYESLFKWCRVVLEEYKLDDFHTWKYLNTCCVKLNRDNYETLSSFGKSRNALLARIDYEVKLGKLTEATVTEYLVVFGCKNCAFIDLKQYLEHINPEFLIKWFESNIDEIKSINQLTTLINQIRFKIYLNKDLLKDDQFVLGLTNDYNKYKSLFNSKSNNDYFIGDELLLFTVQSLLSNEFSQSNIIKSILILEKAVTKDQHEFHLRLWLIQLYELINCHSKALAHYDTLSIKNIQHDILDYFINSRLSTKSTKPSELNKITKFYQEGEQESIYYIKVGFNKCVFNKLEGLIEFQRRLSNSFTRKHAMLQGLQIGRLINDKSVVKKFSELLEVLPNVVDSDNRDFKIFWDFGIFEEFEFKQRIFENVPMGNYNQVIYTQEKLLNFRNNVSLDLSLDCLTEVESWSFKVIKALAQFLKSAETKYYDEYEALINRAPDTPPGQLLWKVVHNFIQEVYTRKSVVKMVSSSSKKIHNGIDKNVLNQIKKHNLQALELLKDDELPTIKTEIKYSIEAFGKSLMKDEILSNLEISAGFIKDISESISFSNVKSLDLGKLFN